MALSTKILQQIEACVDRTIYKSGIKAGKYFSAAFEGKGRNQASNLKTRAYQTTRLSEIINFVKNQIGKEKQGVGWLKKVAKLDDDNRTLPEEIVVGQQILDDLENLADQARKLQHRPLIPMEASGKEELDAGRLSDSLRGEFRSRGIHLDDTPSVQVRKQGRQWQIEDSRSKFFLSADNQGGKDILRIEEIIYDADRELLEALEVRLRLARAYVDALTTQYLYDYKILQFEENRP